MTTYVYETIPKSPEEPHRYYEIQQGMNEAPLTVHPETGEPIGRVVLGGFGLLSSGTRRGGSSCCDPRSGCCR